VAIPARKSGAAFSLAHARDITQTAALVAKLLAGVPAKGGSR
jgi:putative aminopeptidase FrvX